MPIIKSDSRRHFYYLMLFALIISFGFQGSRGLFESTEGRYAEVAREMVTSGDYLVPRLNYQPHWTKPPVAYWVFAAGIELLGANDWGVRVGNALAFFFIVLIVVKLGEAMWDEKTGILAGIIYASSLFPVVAANNVSTDTILSLWEILTVFSYWKAFRTESQHISRRWMLLLWFFSALAFLTKGPPALLSLLVVLIFHFYRKRRGQKTPSLAAGFGLPLFLVVGFSWYLIVIMKYPGLLDYFLGQEVAARILTKKFNRNPEWYAPLYVYGAPFLLGAGAWGYLWPQVFGKLKPVKRFRDGFWERLRQNPPLLFLFFWIVFPTIILSLSQSRLPLYVLPFFPAVALLFGNLLRKKIAEKGNFRRVWAIALLSGTLLLAAKKGADHFPSHKNMKPLAKVCLAKAPPPAHFYLFDEEKLYGLQFYLGDRLRRVTDEKNPPPGILNLDRLLDRLKDEKSGVKVVFVLENKNLERLGAHLGRKNFPFRLEKGLERYQLLVLEKKTD